MKRLKLLLITAMLLTSLATGTLRAYAADTNLIANPSVETLNGSDPANWTANSWGTNTANFSYLNDGHTGSKSLSVTVSGRTNGDAKWMPDAVSVSANTSYTYSDWYKSSVGTELDAQITDGSGNVSYAYLGSASASSAWKQTTATFTTPANAAKVSVFHILAANGSLETDDFSFAPTVTATPTANNYILNSSFETNNGGVPANWSQDNWGTNAANFSYDSTGHTGSHSATVTMTGYTNGDAKWSADPVSVTGGASYTYTDFYKATVATPVVAAYIDGSGNYSYVNLATAPASSAWTQYSTTLTAPSTAKQVVIYHLIQSVGTLSIDDVTLYTASTTPTGSTSGNLVPNSSLETVNGTTPANWTQGSWGTNTPVFSYLTSGAHTGSHAASITMKNYSSGDAKWIFDPVAVSSDTQYSFSIWYKSTVQTQVDAVFTMPDGSTQYEMIGIPDASSTWKQFASTFTVPSGAKDMTVYQFIERNGTLTIDDANLQVFSPVPYNRAIVSLTFDDGYGSNYTNVLPLLKKYGFSATDYIVTSLMGTSGYMTQSQVKALSTAGLEIGSHTITHNPMNAETPTTYDKELSQSQTTLQNLIGKPVTTFAYPEGLYTKAVQTDAAKYYAAQRGVEAGLNAKNNLNVQDIKVQNIDNTTTTAQVQDWVNQALATKTWLVLVYHSVYNDTTHDQYNTTPANLDSQLSAIKASGITVETMAQALAEVAAQQ